MHSKAFRQVVQKYYHAHARNLPWRQPEPSGTFDAYKILVSEMMLQQTQVSRVQTKYVEFLSEFPNIHALADAPLKTVISAWSGLGYNRRAKYLHDAAKNLRNITQPWTIRNLTSSKGIGHNTAAAVCVYAYNQPHIFIETNIRTAIIYHFFNNETSIDDKILAPIVEKTLDTENPREWYWALMDYGTYIKRTVGNTSRRSKHYSKQSAFEGSARQIRGQVLKLLGEKDMSATDLQIVITDSRLPEVIRSLKNEGLISHDNSRLKLGS